MHFTEPVYRNPYWPTWPLVEVTQGCTHNQCKVCTMYKGVKCGVQPLELIEHLECDCSFITHHTSTINLTGPNFLERKPQMVAALQNELDHGDLERSARLRSLKMTL